MRLDVKAIRRRIQSMRQLVLIAPLVFATSAFAECPAPPDIDAAQDALFAEAQTAPNEMAGRAISQRLWALWATAPDARAQEMLDRGMNARASYNFEGAITAFDALTTYCPDYAEGYNQRAFVYFLLQDYSAALEDLDLALERSPRHVAAISGKALTLMGLERPDEAQDVLREALALNPWIPERGLLIEPPGQEL